MQRKQDTTTKEAISLAASAMGRQGGLARTAKKIAASKRNMEKARLARSKASGVKPVKANVQREDEVEETQDEGIYEFISALLKKWNGAMPLDKFMRGCIATMSENTEEFPGFDQPFDTLMNIYATQCRVQGKNNIYNALK